MRSLLYILILLVVAGCSCSGAKNGVLDEAERMMLSDPSAALSKLNGVDVSELEDSATVARWALLYSEAMVANRLSAPNDTIVDIAVDYYGRHNLADEFRKASRLKALIQSADTTDALARALYLQKEKEFFLYKERARRGMYIFVGLVVMLVAAGSIVWMRQRLRVQSLLNETLMAEASGLRSRIDASRDDYGRLEARLRGQLDDRFALIDSLCQTYYESQGTKTERKAIVDKVRSEIESVRTDSFPKLEKAVNDCRDNLLARVRDAFPEMKPDDYQLLVYISSGLSTRTISLLIGESVDVVYKRKSRLKSRLKNAVGAVGPDVMDVF